MPLAAAERKQNYATVDRMLKLWEGGSDGTDQEMVALWAEDLVIETNFQWAQPGRVYIGHTGLEQWFADSTVEQMLEMETTSMAQDTIDGSVTVRRVASFLIACSCT